jgi:hypothetical protein
MTRQWSRVLALVALLAATAVSASAAPLFSPLADETDYQKAVAFDTAFHALAQDPAAASIQVVRANPSVVSLKAAAMTLNLGPGLNLEVRRLNAYTMNTGSLVWAGGIVEPGSRDLLSPTGSVLLVRNHGTVTGNVYYNGESFWIRPLKTGTHAIVRVDDRMMPPDHPAEYKDLPVIPMPATRPSSDKANTVITVMANWTQSVAAASGNASALVDLSVADANQTYANSGIAITLQLVNKAQVTYTESGNFSTDLSRYRSTSDGFMDSIHTTRNSSAADVAVLLINNSSSCGLASGIGSTASTAFAAVHWSCSSGNLSFPHEIGHLQSARHDPATDPTSTPFAYGHGLRFTGSPAWRTVMAYPCPTVNCPRIKQWSSPLVTFNGVATGTAALNDNARVLNSTRATVAAFR